VIAWVSVMAAITESKHVIAPFLQHRRTDHPCLMSLRTVVLDLMAVGVLLSLISIMVFALFSAVITVMTVITARRHLRKHASHIDRLAGLSGIKDLAEIDEALERIMGEERGALVGSQPG
jgi:hypothetical protein